jgi:hypothetical protein
MDKADMKPLLRLSKKEPVNFAFGQGKDPSVALLLLSKRGTAKKLDDELTTKFADAKNTRWGRALVDEEVDPKHVRFYVNKEISGMARRLIKTLKGTGYTSLEILLEDETVIDSFAEPDDNAAADPSAAAPAPPPGAAAPAADPASQAAALAATLTHLAQDIPKIAAGNSGLQQTLAKLAVAANTALKAGDIGTATKGIAELRSSIAAAGQAKPQAQAEAGGGTVTYAKARLAWVAARRKLESDVEALRRSLAQVYAGEPEFAGVVDAKFQERAAPTLSALGEELADQLDQATNETSTLARAELVNKVRETIDRYSGFVANDPVLTHLDSNPIVPLATRKMLTDTLATLAKVVH